ncbi:hypothetical protein FFF34_018265 [Inquilinus sp. KBS0705]|nr:hypothetical protein FFF34_018265 [Inquilinus sp. KBS0705]
MKKALAAAAIIASTLVIACKGNPQGAMGVNDKPDTTLRSNGDRKTGRTEAAPKDSVKSIGPGKDKYHVTDSEDKKKH